MADIDMVRRNMSYICSQLSALWKNISLLIKFLCISILCFYFLSYSEQAVDVISVTPGHIIPPQFWIWTAFTHCFMELHLWEVIVDWMTLGLCGKLLEPLWGTLEMFTFFGIVNLSVAVLSTMIYFFAYALTSNPHYLFSVQIHGLAGYIAGVIVAVKQIMPEHVVLKTPVGKILNRNLPLLIFLCSVLLWLLSSVISIVDSSHPVMFFCGLISSWVYLRFYQLHTNGMRGDMAESFSFAT